MAYSNLHAFLTWVKGLGLQHPHQAICTTSKWNGRQV